MDAAKKKIAKNLGLGTLLFVIFVGTGWGFLSAVEGWLGVLLWVLVAIPACFVLEFVLRPKTATHRSPRSLPRMRVRAPVRGDPERAQPATRVAREPEFNWHREATPAQRRRRSYMDR